MTTGEALAAGMAVAAMVVAAVSRGDARRIALHMLVGLAVVRLIVWHAPPDLRWIGIAAVWVCVAADAVSRHAATSAALIVLSALCYPAAAYLAAPAHIGNPALLFADLFWCAALFGVWWGGRSAKVDHGGTLGGRDRRRPDHAVACAASAAQAQGALTERY